MARIYRNPAIAPAENKMEHPVVETKEVAGAATSEAAPDGGAPVSAPGKPGRKKAENKQEADGGE
ncbi:MAG: hypothetical protein LBD02_01695 [Christensenellaceae bacterium]|nr:hypothetical protein [Christensenellaceae bacterium]